MVREKLLCDPPNPQYRVDRSALFRRILRPLRPYQELLGPSSGLFGPIPLRVLVFGALWQTGLLPNCRD